MADAVPSVGDSLAASWATAFPGTTDAQVQAAVAQMQQDCYEESRPECGPDYPTLEFYAAVSLINDLAESVTHDLQASLLAREIPWSEQPGSRVLQTPKIVSPNTGGGLAMLCDGLLSAGLRVCMDVPAGCSAHVAVWMSIPACLRREGQQPPPSIEGRVTVTYESSAPEAVRAVPVPAEERGGLAGE